VEDRYCSEKQHKRANVALADDKFIGWLAAFLHGFLLGCDMYDK
jgi:hypothetical protein